jgi:IclR family acetate operon transcriptional repressor
MAMPYRVQSIERGIDILNVLAEGPQSVTEVAQRTSLAKGTAFRLLASLSYHHYVVREPGGTRYLLGPGLLPLIQHLTSTFGWIMALAGDPLRELWKETEETVTVHVRIGVSRVCVEEIPSPHALRYTASIDATVPVHVGAAGKILLAFEPPDEVDKLFPQLTLEPLTAGSITDLDELKRELELTRARGWAESAGERIEGSAAVSAPVQLEGMLAALSVLGPAQRMTPDVQQSYVPLVQRTAAAVERLVARANGAEG